MLRQAAFAVIAWICLTCAGAAQTPTFQTLTFPALTGRVVDNAGLLSAAESAALTESLAGLEAKTTDQLVIVTLKSLQGAPIEDYGYQLGRNWQIGQKDKNSGALLIVAKTEQKVRIEVGYGLEGTLTDALTRYIIESSILPRFKAGDFAGGIKQGTERIIQVLTGDTADLKREAAQSTARSTRPADTPTWPAIALGVAAVGLLIFCVATQGALCRGLMQIIFIIMLSGGRGGSSRGNSSFSGGGGSFGGGGSSGSW
jgi:uncharacterized protein